VKIAIEPDGGADQCGRTEAQISAISVIVTGASNRSSQSMDGGGNQKLAAYRLQASAFPITVQAAIRRCPTWLKAGQHDHQNYQAYHQDCREIGFREFQEPLDDLKQDVDNDEPNQSDDDQPAYQLQHSSPPKSQDASCTTLLLLMRAAASAMVNPGRPSRHRAPLLADL
jgi:hypothetical protein